MTILPLLLAASLASGNAEFEAASVNAAAEIALGRLKAELAEPSFVSNALLSAMLADPAAFRTRDEAERRCREIYRSALASNYLAKAEDVVRSLKVSAKPAPPEATTLEAAVTRNFANAFAAERQAACTEQARHIALRVKPDEADLESKSDDAARAWLTDRIASAKGLSVFEENLKYISEKIVDPILADARKERKRQQDYLMRTRSDAFAPSVLAKDLEANLRRNVAERKAKCDDPERAWNVFPKTLRESLPVAVERRLVSLAAKEADAAPLVPDAGDVRQTIATNPAPHRAAAASENIFRGLYAERLTDEAIAKCALAAPAAEREEFGSYIREHVRSNAFERAVDARLKRDVMPKWRTIRQTIAKEDADRLWPTLADRTWFPDADLADRTAARSDFAEVVHAWRRTPELDALSSAEPKSGVLEETDGRADASVAAAFELARTAIVAQREIVNEAHPAVLAAAKDLSKGLFSTKPSLAEVTDILTKTVEETWRKAKSSVLWKNGPKPANADEQHAALFPSVKREIELVARQILEEMQREEKAKESGEGEEKKLESGVGVGGEKAKESGEGEEKKLESGVGVGGEKAKESGEGEEKKTPEEKPPEEPPPETPPPQEEKPEEELCTISFELSGGEVTVSAKRGSKTVAERKEKATAQGFKKAVSEVGDIVGREVFKLR